MNDKNLKEEILKRIDKNPLLQKEIYESFKAHSKTEKEAIRNALKELQEEGKIYKDSRNRYCKVDENLAIGIINFTKEVVWHLLNVKMEEKLR